MHGMTLNPWTRWASAAVLGVAAAAPAMAHSEQEQLLAVAEFFKQATVVAGPTAVDCTLSGGTKTRCFSITVKPQPGGYTPGPWCPTQGSDGPDKSGIWLKDGQVLDADGAFMGNMPELYQDKNWQMVDPQTGKIKVTDTREACEAAARPDVDPKYRNYCVQCLPEYLESDHQTYVIPLEPLAPAKTSEVRTSGAGLAFNGVRLDGPAPLDAILGAYTVAPFDDCGGHVNLHAGYHYHAVTDCLNKSAPAASHGPQVGMALDGHMIFASQTTEGQAPADLDRCNGHTLTGLGYHYHAGAPGGNSILACLSAEAGCALEGDAQTCDASQQRRPPPGGRPPPPPPPRLSTCGQPEISPTPNLKELPMMLRISIASAVLVLAGCAGPNGHHHPRGEDGHKGMGMKHMGMKDKGMSFFVTSVNPGKGADLGGLAGADAHCAALAEAAGVKGKNWKAYLSSTKENARDRIGKGPWMNAKGVVVATSVDNLHSDANNLTKENALDENGMVVNGRGDKPNRHDVMTASNAQGLLEGGTCNDWTSSGEGSILVGHHDRTGGGAAPTSWNAAHPSKGCGMEALKSTGGDGLYYCFAAN